MSVGGGKSSGSTSSTSPYAGMLAKFGKSALPIFQQLNSQISEALKTGGVNSQIPLINRSVDATRAAESQALDTTRQDLARTGQGNTSFGTQQLAEERQSGANRIADIGPTMASQFINMSPGQTGQGIGALGTAGFLTRNINTSSNYSQSAFDPSQFISDLMGGIFNATKGGGGSGWETAPSGAQGAGLGVSYA